MPIHHSQMPLDILYYPTFFLTLFACFTLLILMLCSALLGQELTKPVVMSIGFAFVGVGVYEHITMIDMVVRGEKSVSDGLVSAQVFANFERYKEVFTYFFPAISVAVGTNVISDALLKHQTYERKFSFLQFTKDITLAVSLPLGILFVCIALLSWVISLPIGSARRLFSTTVLSIWRWTQLKFLKLSIVSRHTVRRHSGLAVSEVKGDKAKQRQ